MRTPEELPLPDGFIADGMNGLERFIKRAFDLLVALVSIIISTPVFLLCWILVKWDDGGKAIFSQTRTGRGGRTFRIYKFRTMTPNAEEDGKPELCKPQGDPRITPIGSFLRAHHLDELPQLWNVLRGDMAFVGPRPERPYFIRKIMEHDARYEYLYQIRPGITSYATLYNGYTDTMDKMLKRLHYDLYYLGHRSFKFDCKILWHTFVRIVRGDRF